jgi:hypothetical protein
MRTRFGELPIETQKAINGLTGRRPATGVCEQEMTLFLRCIKKADWDVAACPDQLEALQKCNTGGSGEVVCCQSCVAFSPVCD